MDGYEAVDALRVLSLSLGMVMFGLTVGVLHAYYRVWKKAKHTPTGILPFHVWTIAGSHCLAIAFMCAEIMSRLDNSTAMSWRTPIFLGSSVLGIASLVSVLRFELRRKARLEGEKVEGGSRYVG